MTTAGTEVVRDMGDPQPTPQSFREVEGPTITETGLALTDHVNPESAARTYGDSLLHIEDVDVQAESPFRRTVWQWICAGCVGMALER